MKINMGDDLLAKIMKHKNEVIESRQNDHILNNFGFMVDISEAKEPYIIYSYYIRSVLAFIIKAALFNVFEIINKQHNGKARIITNIWDSFLIEIVDKYSEDVLYSIKEAMQKPLSCYGHNWEFATTTTKLGERT
jgi:hypothetical protein